MAEPMVDSDNPSAVDEDPTIIKLNKQIYFTSEQIESLLKFPSFVNLDPQSCVTLVSSTLQLENVEVNNNHFWLADTLAAVIKNILLARMSVLQGTIVIRWFLHFVSLVIGEEKLSKIESFENLRKCMKVGHAHAEEFMIPLPNSTECPKYVALVIKQSPRQSPKIKKPPADNNVPVVTAAQIVTFILNTIRDIFWDDFKYTVIQTAFDVDAIQPKQTEYSIIPVAPVDLTGNDDGKNHVEDATKTRGESHECLNATVMDRYFLRGSAANRIPPSPIIVGLRRSLCLPASGGGFDVADDDEAIMPLSAAILTKDTEKYVEKLRKENRQKRAGSNVNARAPTSRARSVYRK